MSSTPSGSDPLIYKIQDSGAPLNIVMVAPPYFEIPRAGRRRGADLLPVARRFGPADRHQRPSARFGAPIELAGKGLQRGPAERMALPEGKAGFRPFPGALCAVQGTGSGIGGGACRGC